MYETSSYRLRCNIVLRKYFTSETTAHLFKCYLRQWKLRLSRITNYLLLIGLTMCCLKQHIVIRLSNAI